MKCYSIFELIGENTIVLRKRTGNKQEAEVFLSYALSKGRNVWMEER